MPKSSLQARKDALEPLIDALLSAMYKELDKMYPEKTTKVYSDACYVTSALLMNACCEMKNSTTATSDDIRVSLTRTIEHVINAVKEIEDEQGNLSDNQDHRDGGTDPEETRH